MPPTLAHSADFLASIDVAIKTGLTYRHALQALAEFLTSGSASALSVVPLNQLKEDTLAQFRGWMRKERGYGRRTEETYLAGAVRFIEWLDAHGQLPPGLQSSRMKLLLRESKGRRRVGYKTQPIKEAVPLIIQYFDSLTLPTDDKPRPRRQRLSILRNRAMVHTLFATGLRAQELASLRRSDISDDSDKILITGKGEKERVVMLNAEAKKAIQNYLKARDEARSAASRQPAPATRRTAPLFVRHDRDQATAISTKTVWLVIAEAAKALGLEASISPHDFRRYIATTMLSEGMPLESVQAFLGHESIVTTRTVYAHTWSEVLDDQVQTYRPSPAQAMKRAKQKTQKMD